MQNWLQRRTIIYTQCKWKHNRSMECKSSEWFSSIIIKTFKTSTSLSGQGKFSDGEQKTIAVCQTECW